MGNKPIAVQLSGPRGPALRLERAKGVSVKNLNKTRKFPERWTEKEHGKFLEGVEALGKGKYKEIAERFVTTRTHQQVRDHAKNHFKKLGEVASSARYAETKWSAEEHARFLKGLEKYGKGNWKAISENLVPTRTRQQVTSHAVKYFRKIGEPFSDKGYRKAPAKKAVSASIKSKTKIRKRTRRAPRRKDHRLSRNWPAESLVALTGRY